MRKMMVVSVQSTWNSRIKSQVNVKCYDTTSGAFCHLDVRDDNMTRRLKGGMMILVSDKNEVNKGHFEHPRYMRIIG